MGRYLTRRLLQMLPILIGVSMIVFFVLSMAPGDAVDSMAASSGNMTPEKIQQLKHLYHLDQPKIVQYFYWMKRAIVGDLGDSYKYHQPVGTVIKGYIWNSFYLSLASFIFSILIAIPLGVISATKQYSISDSMLTLIALIGISLPTFFMGLILIKWLAIDITLFPVAGMVKPGSNETGLAKVLDVLHHMFLPFLVLTFHNVARLMRYVRTNMLEVIRQDYIRTARAKGLSEKVVIYKHALKNSMIPIITILGMWLPGLFSGAIIIEQIFGWPGIGNITLAAIDARDYPLLLGFNMLLALLTIVGNLLADVVYAIVDPRVKF